MHIFSIREMKRVISLGFTELFPFSELFPLTFSPGGGDPEVWPLPLPPLPLLYPRVEDHCLHSAAGVLQEPHSGLHGQCFRGHHRIRGSVSIDWVGCQRKLYSLVSEWTRLEIFLMLIMCFNISGKLNMITCIVHVCMILHYRVCSYLASSH